MNYAFTSLFYSGEKEDDDTSFGFLLILKNNRHNTVRDVILHENGILRIVRYCKNVTMWHGELCRARIHE